VALNTVKAEQDQFTHLRERFHVSLTNRLKRLFPSLNSLQVENLATDLDFALAGYFREGGLTLASTVLTNPTSLSQVVPASVLKFINQAAAQYDDHLRRQAFSGSAQQSDEGRILGGFLESDEFGLGGGQPLCLQQQIVQIAVASATT